MPQHEPGAGKMIQAGVLTWLLPGAGHYLAGHRALAAVFFIGISFPYCAGLLVGGLKNSVNPWSNPWLFLAEMGTGGYTSAALLANKTLGEPDPAALGRPDFYKSLDDEQRRRYAPYLSAHPESDVAQIYLATAGLLNILAILDAIARVQFGGLPTFNRHLRRPAPLPAEGKL